MTSVDFGEINSQYDLCLLLTSYNIGPAIPKTNFVDVPGADGSIDLTEALGAVNYADREAEFQFVVSPYFQFEDVKKLVSNAINGTKMRITMRNDAEYYYIGRPVVDEYEIDGVLHLIKVKAKLAPWKYKQEATTVEVNGNASVVLQNGRKPVVPTITATANTQITFEGNVFNVGAGTHRVPGIVLTEFGNALEVKSSGKTTFVYQEADL